jgi:hypothetical protein
VTSDAQTLKKETRSMSEEKPLDGPDAADSHAGREHAEAPREALAIGPWRGLLFACVGGLLTWGFLQTAFPVFRLPPELAAVTTMSPPDKQKEQSEASARNHQYNTIFVLGLLGALVAGSLAVGEGLARRSFGTILVGGAGCALAAAIFGCLAGFLGHFSYLKLQPVADLSPLAKTIRMQAIMLGALGGGVGLALGPLSKRWTTFVVCLIAGILAGALAGMLYPMLAARFLPVAITEIDVPLDFQTRLLWVGLPAVLLGLSIPRSARKGRPPRRRG